MKYSLLLGICAAAFVPAEALSIPPAIRAVQRTLGIATIDRPLRHLDQLADDLYLVELEPGRTKWIKEDEKWELRRVGQFSGSWLRKLRS